jgi:glucose-fructose oxidoreductase
MSNAVPPHSRSRRRALQSLALAGLAPWLPASGKEKPMKRLGVALVGLGGYSSDLLAPALQLTKHCRLAGIVTGSPWKIEPWQRKYGIPDRNVYDYANFARIADNPDIDVIYVVLPTSMHAEYAIRAAGTGKHVWCEKPMAMNAAEAQSMIDACAKNKVRLAIGYRLRHEPITRQVMAWAKEKPYGGPLKLSAAAGYYGYREGYDPGNWRLDPKRGGNPLYDMGVYSINAARYASGLEPVAVTAHAEVKRPDVFRGMEETMRFDLEFPGGLVASCATSYGEDMNALRVDCERGWYRIEPFQVYAGNRGTTSDGKVLDMSLGPQPHMQAQQMDDDALAILHGTPFIAPGEEGLRDLRVVDAAFASARADGKRVEIAQA